MQSLSKMHEVTPKQRPPTADEIRAAAGCRIPDLIAPGLKVLFCGINPGLYSAATKHHFARPGNRFWPALHLAKFTPRLLEQFTNSYRAVNGSLNHAVASFWVMIGSSCATV